MAKLMSKSELIQKIADQHSNCLTRKDIKGVIEFLASVGYKELKKTGAFFVPGFAKFVVIKTCHKAAYWHQSVYKGTHSIQGQASQEGYQGSPSDGCQRRSCIRRECPFCR